MLQQQSSFSPTDTTLLSCQSIARHTLGKRVVLVAPVRCSRMGIVHRGGGNKQSTDGATLNGHSFSTIFPALVIALLPLLSDTELACAPGYHFVLPEEEGSESWLGSWPGALSPLKPIGVTCDRIIGRRRSSKELSSWRWNAIASRPNVGAIFRIPSRRLHIDSRALEICVEVHAELLKRAVVDERKGNNDKKDRTSSTADGCARRL